MIDTWNPAKLNEKISGRDSWNPAILNEAVTDRDSWNPAILNESAGETPVVFEATITASFPEGATCTATDGTTTLTADDNPMAFSIPNSGTWTVACIANGVTLSEDVVITTDGQTETVNLTPVGATVTPTDSVPMLIACAGIGDSEITTIAGLLTDSTTLVAVISSSNAIDYLVRSTTFASSITADSTAMTYIGANNYASNTLLADSTWLEAICNSQYIESVLNFKNPVMTSNNQPSGQCSGTNATSDRPFYFAFDNNMTTYWASNSYGSNPYYLQYDFGSEVDIKCIKFYLRNNTATAEAVQIKFETSLDDLTWDNLGTVTETTSTDITVPILYTLIDNIHARYFKFNRLTGSSRFSAFEVKMYGRVDV